MTISELIERLEALKAEQGDVSVWIEKDVAVVKCAYIEFFPDYGVIIE